LAISFNSSNTDSGRRSEIVFIEGLSFGNTILLAFFQSTYSVESWESQNCLSSSSFLKRGIFFFMVSISLSFFSVHVSCGDDSNSIDSNGKHKKKQPAGVGFTEHKKAIFFLRMFRIISNYKRQIKKNLFALSGGNTMPCFDLFGIVVIPFKSGTFI
jgi:hypothetical protein